MTADALFAAALAVAWLNSGLHGLLSDRPVFGMSPRAMRGPIRPGAALGLVAATLLFLGALALWGWSGHRLLGGGSALVLLGILRRWEVAQWPAIDAVALGKYAPAAACLAGWVVGAAVAEWSGTGSPARVGWEAAAGVVTAQYLLAVASKLRRTGLAWMDAGNHQLLVLERSFSGPAPLRALRRRAAALPRFGAVMGTYGLLSEAAFALYLFPPARLPLCALNAVLHLGFALFLGYFAVEWWLVLAAVTLATVG